MTRFTAILAAALLSVVVLAVPAFAQYPPAEGPVVSVDDTTVVAGETTTICGSGWLPGSTVTITLPALDATLGTADVDDDGDFCADVTIPAGAPVGTHTVRISGTGEDGEARTVDIAITVAADADTVADADDDDDDDDGDDDGDAAGVATGGLASTGGFFSSTSAVGALLLVVGGGALYASRRLTKPGAQGR